MELLDEYNGDIILTERLTEFYPNGFKWNEKIITEEMVKSAIENGDTGINEEYGNQIAPKIKSDEWHVSRIVYFVLHPEEIRNINIDNVARGMHICPIPIILDGNHRFFAAIVLKMQKVHCLYGGREDLLDYLTGKTNICPTE